MNDFLGLQFSEIGIETISLWNACTKREEWLIKDQVLVTWPRDIKRIGEKVRIFLLNMDQPQIKLTRASANALSASRLCLRICSVIWGRTDGCLGNILSAEALETFKRIPKGLQGDVSRDEPRLRGIPEVLLILGAPTCTISFEKHGLNSNQKSTWPYRNHWSLARDCCSVKIGVIRLDWGRWGRPRSRLGDRATGTSDATSNAWPRSTRPRTVWGQDGRSWAFATRAGCKKNDMVLFH